MKISSPSRNISARKPSHLGSKIQSPSAGNSSTRFASMGRIGGFTGRSTSHGITWLHLLIAAENEPCPMNLDYLRRFAVNQSLFAPTTLKRALRRFGFVQADPIRAPARAQDLILRHRVKNYRAGDLERNYTKLGIEEDFFVNYGFVTRSLQALMHPRSDNCVGQGQPPWPAARRKRAQLLLDFVRERGAVHPREVDEHFSHGKVKNYWGGSSNATTRLL